jgi:hypothetical protein
MAGFGVHRAPVVILEATGGALVERSEREAEQPAGDLHRHGVDAIANREAVDVEGTTADAACVAGSEEPAARIEAGVKSIDVAAAARALEDIAEQ